jgi:hypothetical protein
VNHPVKNVDIEDAQIHLQEIIAIRSAGRAKQAARWIFRIGWLPDFNAPLGDFRDYME